MIMLDLTNEQIANFIFRLPLTKELDELLNKVRKEIEK